MSFKSLLAAGLAAVAMIGAPATGIAQESSSEAPAAAAPAAATPDQNWLKVCETAVDGKRACLVRQTVLTANGQFLGAVMVRTAEGRENEPVLVAVVPLGVLLPPRLTLKIDDGSPVGVPYAQCSPENCYITLVVNQTYVDSLKKGKRLTMTARNRKNEDLVIPIDLAGFTAVFDSEVATTAPATGTGGANQLQEMLTQRAEQERQELLGSSSAEQPSSAQ